MSATDRAHAIAWAASTTGRNDVVYLDTETTGIDHTAEVIDVAVVDGAGDVLLNSLVRPLRPIPWEATRIHGITDRMVASAPEWPVVCDALGRILTGRICVVYNAAFDRKMIDSACQRHRLPLVLTDWHCAMLQYAAYAGAWDDRHGNYRWHTLENAAKAVGAPMPPTHRALADTQACSAVVLAMSSAPR